MADRQPEPRRVVPQDVFARSNMPSRWERIWGVAPKTVCDRKFLAFVAARYRGEVRLPHPDSLVQPGEVTRWHSARTAAYVVGPCAGLLTIIGLASNVVWIVALGIAVLLAVAIWIAVVRNATQPAIRTFSDKFARSTQADQRLHADPMDQENTRTIEQMILCDEGTLAYCAAKIASEIEQDPAWTTSHVGFVPIDLWDEVAEAGEGARQISHHREAATELERSRLRDDAEVKIAIDEYQQRRRESIAGLAARIHAFADFRDRVHRAGVLERSEAAALGQAWRSAVDDVARDRFD